MKLLPADTSRVCVKCGSSKLRSVTWTPYFPLIPAHECSACSGKGTVKSRRDILALRFSTQKQCLQCLGKGTITESPGQSEHLRFLCYCGYSWWTEVLTPMTDEEKEQLRSRVVGRMKKINP